MDVLISGIGQYLIFVVAIAAVVITAFSKKSARNRIIRLAVLSFILAFVIDYIAGKLYYNPRPFVVDHTQPLFSHQAGNGFPSEHTMITMVFSAVIFTCRRKFGILLGILGLLVGTARVIAGVHHPVDILGGIAIAVISTGVAWLIWRRVERSRWWASLVKFTLFAS
jgi:undecaprenyl-diphosphatase